MEDQKLKDDIELLSPLSVGVVFGKEDAWDKLQNRLEAKPKRKILPVYWWAAAAVLLIVCGIAVESWRSAVGSQQLTVGNSQPVVDNKTKETTQINEAAHTTAPVTPPPATTMETPVTMKTNTITPGPVTITKHVDEIAPIAIQQPEAQQLPDPIPVANVVVAAPAVKQPMKVVHINELNSEGYSTRPATAAKETTNSGIAVNKMPVVHLNNVLRDERRQYYNIQETKPSNNVFTFMKPSHEYKFTISDGLLTTASVKIKIRN